MCWSATSWCWEMIIDHGKSAARAYKGPQRMAEYAKTVEFSGLRRYVTLHCSAFQTVCETLASRLETMLPSLVNDMPTTTT